MRGRRTAIVVVAVMLGGAVVGAARYATADASMTSVQKVVTGRQLYRKFCGKCHALNVALAAGFGSNGRGLGDLGGPSFNELRVPYSYSVTAITEPTGGHEIVRKRMNPKQLEQVSLWIAKVTRHHPIPALPTDG